MTLHHDILLTLAGKAHRAASGADAACMRKDLGLFVHALNAHVNDESPLFTQLPPAEARLLQRGQKRVSKAAEALLAEAVAGCAGTAPQCGARTEELLDLLALQTLDERRAFRRSADSTDAAVS